MSKFKVTIGSHNNKPFINIYYCLSITYVFIIPLRLHKKKALFWRAFFLKRLPNYEIKVAAFGAVAVVQADVEAFGRVYDKPQAGTYRILEVLNR